jgi:membrane-associated phospholipid phosphatase
MTYRTLASIALGVALGLGCVADRSRASSIVTEWLDESVPAANEVAWEPTVGARFLALVHTAIYDAWAAYDPVAVGVQTGRRLKGLAGPPTVVNKRESISHAAYEVLQALAPGRRKALVLRMRELGYDPASQTPAARVGREAAQAVLAAARDDGANQAGNFADTTGYRPAPEGADRWQPIRALGADQLPLTPHWSRVLPFALSHAAEFRPPPPPAAGTPDWDEQVRALVAVSAGLTDREKAIAEFWVPWGSPPPAHMLELTRYLSARDDMRLDEEVKLFFVIGVALHDTAIATWEAKYHYGYARPLTAIRALGNVPLKGWRPPATPPAFAYSAPVTRSAAESRPAAPPTAAERPAAEWSSYLPTPAFPAYVSGHAAFTAAWARAAELATGKAEFGLRASVTRLYTEQRLLDVPVELVYPTLWSAAEASGVSRIYGGIHWPVDHTEGLALGRKVAEKAWRRANAFLLGTASPASAILSDLAPTSWLRLMGEGEGAPVGATARQGLAAALPPLRSAAWISRSFDPLPEGDWTLTVRIAATEKGSLSLRLLDAADREIAARTDAAFASGETDVVLAWRSEGSGPARIEIRARAGEAATDVRVSGARLHREWDVKDGAPRFRTMRSVSMTPSN